MFRNMFKSNAEKLQESIFEMKFSAKQLEREAKKSEKEENEMKKKVKKCMESGHMDRARIYAESAIRKKNESLNYLKMASRLDAVVGRMKTMQSTQNISKDLDKVSKKMTTCIKSMNMEKITSTMDNFEKVFEDLNVASDTIDQALDQGTTIAKERDEVDEMMAKIADEHGMEISAALEDPSAKMLKPKETVEEKKEDDLSKRLAALQGL